jgi:hypothetical protein
MKISIWLSLIILLWTNLSYANQCKATKIYDSTILEESFSVEEYPDVIWSQDEVYIGSSNFSDYDNDQIQVLATFNFKKIVEITTQSGSQFYISYTDMPGLRDQGTLSYRETSSEEYQLFADLECQ